MRRGLRFDSMCTCTSVHVCFSSFRDNPTLSMADIQGGLIFIKKYSLEATCTTEKDLVKLNLLSLLLLSIVFNVLITILYSYLPTHMHWTAPHDRHSTFSINSYFCFLLLKFSVGSSYM